MSNLILKNASICVCVDKATGFMVSVRDEKKQITYAVEDKGFSITSGNMCFFENSTAVSCEATEDGAEFTYVDGSVTAKLTYIMPKEGAFFEKQLCFVNTEAWTVDSVMCENFRLPQPADEILYHDDQSLWASPINYFIRMGNGGMFCGLEYPYWETECDGKSCLSIAFEPHYGVKAGQEFTAEKTFWGVYTNEGIRRISYGPYPAINNPLPYYDIYRDGGMDQHFVDNTVPEDAGIPGQTLDWGEVWAMQKFLRHHLPKQKLPEDGYWLFQNSWWARLMKPKVEQLGPLLNADIHDMETFYMYYGYSNHPSTEPEYIRDMNIEPMGFPIMRSEKIVSEDPKANANWHGTIEEGDNSDEIIGYGEHFKAPPEIEAFIQEASKHGMHVGSFATPNNAYRKRPQWYARHKDGTPHMYFKTALSCPACDEYMDFHYKMLSDVIDRYNTRFWAFDGRWLNYVEYAGYGKGFIGADPCYCPDHGHPVGDSRYREWKNIEILKKKLRDNHPEMCLEQYYGLKRGGVWSMTQVNSDENYYEVGSIENNRLQAWHNEFSRFRPVYLNFANILGDNPNSFEYNIISAMSISAYGQVASGFNALKDYPECAGTLKKWRAWAKENYRFFDDRRGLFGMTGKYAVDGSAHILNDEGYIYLFCTPKCAADARIPMNSWIGLSKDESATYAIEPVAAVSYDGSEAGCYLCSSSVAYGETLRCRLLPNTAAVLKVRRLAQGETVAPAAPVEFEPDDAVVDAFPNE